MDEFLADSTLVATAILPTDAALVKFYESLKITRDMFLADVGLLQQVSHVNLTFTIQMPDGNLRYWHHSLMYGYASAMIMVIVTTLITPHDSLVSECCFEYGSTLKILECFKFNSQLVG